MPCLITFTSCIFQQTLDCVEQLYSSLQITHTYLMSCTAYSSSKHWQTMVRQKCSLVHHQGKLKASMHDNDHDGVVRLFMYLPECCKFWLDWLHYVTHDNFFPYKEYNDTDACTILDFVQARRSTRIQWVKSFRKLVLRTLIYTEYAKNLGLSSSVHLLFTQKVRMTQRKTGRSLMKANMTHKTKVMLELRELVLRLYCTYYYKAQGHEVPMDHVLMNAVQTNGTNY